MASKPNNIQRKRDASGTNFHHRSESNPNRDGGTQHYKRVVNPYDTEVYKNQQNQQVINRRQAYAASTRPAHRMNAIHKSKPN
jgi:hypothetical protein